ncbi:hypothetical protein PVAP13_5NG553900 [Panicum virgatum]|uniref:Peptidase A1 domain-containing protein n=1 Tax=Panicum virgatum TaxID=38727 RepID=A0A8T0S5K6_PANVG|nr:hypothetical protein PVAP13_5NG553900 [Panicum virgatum]
MSIVALILAALLLFVAVDSSVHEKVASPPFGEPSFKGGFSLSIIHRNALTSPLRDSTLTTWDMFEEEIQLASSDALASEKMVVPSHFRRGLYLVPLRIGGSLDRISSRYLMFDTGIDLSWTQCYPCESTGLLDNYTCSSLSRIYARRDSCSCCTQDCLFNVERQTLLCIVAAAVGSMVAVVTSSSSS